MKSNSMLPLLLLLLLFSIIAPYLNSIPVQAHSNPGGLDFFNSPSGRSLLSHHNNNKAEDATNLITFPDGKLYLVEKDSGKVLWWISTGPPISSLYLKTPAVLDGVGELDLDDKYKVYVGDDDFVGMDDSGDMNLMKIIEEFSNKYISKDRVSFVQSNSTISIVDYKTGRVIDVLDPNGSKISSSEISTVDTSDGSPAYPEKVQLLVVKRTNHELQSLSLERKTLLWKSTISIIDASFIDQEMEPKKLSVIHIYDKDHLQILHGIPRLNHKDAKPPLPPVNGENSTALLNAAGNMGQNLESTTDRSTKKRSPPPEDSEKSTALEPTKDRSTGESNENKISHYSKLQYIAILCFLFVFISWYTGTMTITRHNPTKEVNGSSGENTTIPKRKKARKLLNYKTIAKNSLHDDVEKCNGLSRDERNGKEPWTNLEIPVDADAKGIRIGKLLISNTEIAKGSNGTVVMEGIYDGRPVAVKRLVQAHHDVAYKEIQNLIASDRHPNIVRWYGVEYDSNFVYLSLERCTCTLGDLIKMCSDSSRHSVSTEGKSMDSAKGVNNHVELWKANGYPAPQLLKLMRDMVSGLMHLHELGIIHRDLKPQNILIVNEKFFCAKLSDMGISKRLLEDKSSLGRHPTGYGSSGWQAPEQLLHGRQTRAVDIFGLGCVLFFCITRGKHPYGDHLERDINIVKNQVNLFMVEHIPEAVDLFSRLLDPNPELRPTASCVLHHPLFWSSEIRLSFLRDASDRLELEDRENESDILKALENAGPVALGGNWDEKMETEFIYNIGRYRRYKFDSTRDLLRVMRNKLNHYRELPKKIQGILGPVPEGFDDYFSSRFPKFLMEVYKVIYRYCREEECFLKYFKTV